MSTSPTPLQPAHSSLRGLPLAALVVGIALGTMALIEVSGEFLLDPNTSTVFIAALVFFGMLAFAATYGRSRSQQSKWLIFIVWWSLLVSEEVFSYRSDITSVSGAEFASQAYAQGVLWCVAMLGLLLILIKYPQYLRGMFHGDYKWVSWIALFSVISSAYSPNPAFSLAWAFKLGLVAVVLHVCSQEIAGLEDLKSFLKITVWAFVILTLVPTLRSIFIPDPKGEYGSGELEQRFREAPTEISGIAGLLVIMCLMLYSPGKRRWPLVIAAGALIVMIAAGGKTGIVGGFVSVALFYGLQRRFKAMLGFVGVIAVLVALALRFTSLAAYATGYMQLQQGSSFTGRTELWSFVMPFIMQKPILGHGFIASRFIAVIHPDTPFGSSHMHNGFLEAWYNNGLIGLGLILAINYVIARNLWRAVHITQSRELRYLAVGGFAAYVNLVINGMFNATFGGRPDCSYLMLIAMVVLSIHLLRLAQDSSSPRSLAASAG